MLPRPKRSPTPVPGSSTRNVLRDLVWHAALAPSSHNAQPWRFGLIESGIEVFADRSRALPVLDPDDRELVMSCGAAVLNLRIAIRALGHRDLVEVLPEPSMPDLVARVLLGPTHPPRPEETALCAAIPARRTTSRAFEARSVPVPIVARICAAAAEEGARVVVVDDARKRRELATLVARGDHLMAQDPAYRAALESWMRPAREEEQTSAHEMLSRLAPLLLRTRAEAESHAARVQRLAEEAPLVVAITTMGDDEPSWIGAGQALQRVLLTATTEGVSASFMNQPVEVRGLREELRHLLSTSDHPQVVLRLGYGPPSPPSPRRNVDDVLA